MLVENQQEKTKTSWNLHRNNNSISGNSQILENQDKNLYGGIKKPSGTSIGNIYSSNKLYPQNQETYRANAIVIMKMIAEVSFY